MILRFALVALVFLRERKKECSLKDLSIVWGITFRRYPQKMPTFVG